MIIYSRVNCYDAGAPQAPFGVDGLLLPVSTEKLRFVSDNLLQHEDEIKVAEHSFGGFWV